ncbi:MAG: fumarylacetoacetate hydrolase family protein [Ignavibacteriales bacterium]|nr:fumarylacetoacetate hydrolase family protein [Ignavibacteriales bacterium]
MKVAQFEDTQGYCIGIFDKGRWINLSDAEAAYTAITQKVVVEPTTTILQLLEDGRFDPAEFRVVLQFLEKHKLEKQYLISKDAVLKAPILRPPKIVALGLNYALHAKEGNAAVPKEPIIFMKAGSSVIGPGDTILLPKGLGRMDHEIELAVIIGRRTTAARKKDALSYVAGYTILNDVTARELQTSDLEKKHPWFRSKSYDTFTPLGPWIVTADEIGSPIELGLECRVNGTVRQKSNTKNMVFDVPTQIEFISKFITLEPGDIISTGTPHGIGPIKHGDEVVCRIKNIGELKNPVRDR